METLNIPTANVNEMSKPTAPLTSEFVTAQVKPATEKSGEDLIAVTVKGLPSLNERPGALLRTVKEARADLSAFIPKEILAGFTANELALVYQKYFKGNEVIFNASAHVKGSLYKATADSLAVKNGVAEIGDELKAESDGIWIEGFLSVQLSDEQIDDAVAKAMERVSAKLAEQNAVEA